MAIELKRGDFTDVAALRHDKVGRPLNNSWSSISYDLLSPQLQAGETLCVAIEDGANSVAILIDAPARLQEVRDEWYARNRTHSPGRALKFYALRVNQVDPATGILQNLATDA